MVPSMMNDSEKNAMFHWKQSEAKILNLFHLGVKEMFLHLIFFFVFLVAKALAKFVNFLNIFFNLKIHLLNANLATV